MSDRSNHHAAPMVSNIGATLGPRLCHELVGRKMINEHRLQDDPQRLDRGLWILRGHAELRGDERLLKHRRCPLTIGFVIGELVFGLSAHRDTILAEVPAEPTNPGTGFSTRDAGGLGPSA